jgi:hypothetical protein
MLPAKVATPCLWAALVVGLILGGLLVGYEPAGGDPDTMYRPIKSELARALGEGRLPFWSDRFGLGVPLMAESHAAALYPPNHLVYRLWAVATGYRLAMWAHYVALVVATYGYARCLGVTPWGSAIAALAFAVCGFQNIHNCHEPFYHALPYLLLALILTERYVVSGRWVWLGSIALTWGVQLTLGHFQLPMWTGGLVLLTGVWRIVAERLPWWRGAGLVLALGWGAAVAAVQLGLTWEVSRVAGFDRPYTLLSSYLFPPAHWAQPALPALFMRLPGLPYWSGQQTTPGEACFYVGTVPLILAFVGLAAGRRDRALASWKWIIPLSLILATMPRWWPDAYLALLHLPGVGYFRAPGRYTLLASLGLCLLAGRGFDHAIAPRRFGIGLALAVLFGLGATAWGAYWSQWPELLSSEHRPDLRWSFGMAALAWGLGIATIVAWRLHRLGAWGPFILTAVELGVLFYLGPTEWGWALPIPAASPVMKLLARESDVELLAGHVKDGPVRGGFTPAFPYLGITPPPPNYLLEDAESADKAATPRVARWMRRFGVTHGLWVGTDKVIRGETIYLGPDAVMDRIIPRKVGSPKHVDWRVVRYGDAFPPARVALSVHEAADWFQLYPRLSKSDAADEVWYLTEDLPPDSPGPRARSARLLRWDGRSGEVEHDGTCDLVIRRTYYPGWTARIDDGPETPVRKADGGLQAVRLPGAGVSRVSVSYHPTRLKVLLRIAVLATVLALLAVGLSVFASIRQRRP